MSAHEDARVVAIGELGLDFLKENKNQQIDALIPQLELAHELQLPISIAEMLQMKWSRFVMTFLKKVNAQKVYFIGDRNPKRNEAILGS